MWLGGHLDELELAMVEHRFLVALTGFPRMRPP